MKKLFFIAALCGVLFSCSSKDEPTETHQVKFTVNGWNAVTEHMSPARKAPAVLNDGDGVLTDLYLYDGTTQLAHQVNTAEDFGTITVMLTAGSHNLHFIATRSTGLAYDAGILSATSLRTTFGKTLALDVTGSSEENITLDRLTGKLFITIEDKIPEGASQLRIQVGNMYKSLNVQTLYGVSPVAFDQTVSISGKVNTSGNEWNLYTLAPDADGYETTFTLTATNGSGTTIGQATGTLTLAPNSKTFLTGNLFSGTKSFISLNTTWGPEISVGF